MSSCLLTIVKKELYRVITDRRLLFTAFILPALSIIILYSIMGVMLQNMQRDISEHQAEIYLYQAPKEFETYLQESSAGAFRLQHLNSEQQVQEIKQAIYTGQADVLLIFDATFAEDVQNYRQIARVPQVKTYYNQSEEYSLTAHRRILEELASYEQLLLATRLERPQYINVFDVNRDNQEENVSDPKKAAGKGLAAILPMLMVIFLYSGAMGMGVDSIAGEKERGTMATLLVTPVKRKTIALGKVISLSIIAILGAFSSFVGILLSLPFSSLIITGGAGSIGLKSLHYALSDWLSLLVVMITLAGVFVGTISLASILSKNVKEAGAYSSIIYIFILISAFLNMYSIQEPVLWQYAIPVYGSVLALKGILSFELSGMQLLVTCGAALLYTGGMIFLIQKLFNREGVMFNVN